MPSFLAPDNDTHSKAETFPSVKIVLLSSNVTYSVPNRQHNKVNVVKTPGHALDKLACTFDSSLGIRVNARK